MICRVAIPVKPPFNPISACEMTYGAYVSQFDQPMGIAHHHPNKEGFSLLNGKIFMCKEQFLRGYMLYEVGVPAYRKNVEHTEELVATPFKTASNRTLVEIKGTNTAKYSIPFEEFIKHFNLEPRILLSLGGITHHRLGESAKPLDTYDGTFKTTNVTEEPKKTIKNIYDGEQRDKVNALELGKKPMIIRVPRASPDLIPDDYTRDLGVLPDDQDIFTLIK